MPTNNTRRREQLAQGQAVSRARKASAGMVRLDLSVHRETKRRLMALPPGEREAVILAGLDAYEDSQACES